MCFVVGSSWRGKGGGEEGGDSECGRKTRKGGMRNEILSVDGKRVVSDTYRKRRTW